MKSNSFKIIIFIACATIISGCNQNMSRPDRDGGVKEIVWPEPVNAKLRSGRGVFPTSESISLLNKGMTKDQVYLLIGRPHFGEGLFSVREWDYLLHFNTLKHTNNQVTICQLKIIFNSDKLVANIYWRAIKPENSIYPPKSNKN